MNANALLAGTARCAVRAACSGATSLVGRFATQVPPGIRAVTPQRGVPAIAFSLIELLVVMAVIAILAALALPVISRSQEEGRATACVSNLHQIGLALQIYVDANNNTLPIMRDAPTDTNALATNTFPTVNVVLGTDLANTNVLRCPSDFQGIFQLTGSSYSWNDLLNGENANHLVVMGMDFNPQAIPVFFDKQGFHGARGANKAVNYLYADQHIKNLLTIEGTLPQ
ncbi:MAG TPA: prepilin-type N-terminal cleavage/methylation domain-containing protein [Candidatus Sulfotelmatobacter sp.]|nr:prepilin-type N-terminal cleavage/methylation domain-containing protein [Candidatus Sulfotelmatobacter sp.]